MLSSREKIDHPNFGVISSLNLNALRSLFSSVFSIVCIVVCEKLLDIQNNVMMSFMIAASAEVTQTPKISDTKNMSG
jgi:hypothetical protein